MPIYLSLVKYKYIGAICGSILLMGTLYANNQRNLLTEKGQLDIRFKDAATLLGSSETSSMLAGIYALNQIAKESYKEEGQTGYVKVIHEILCAIIRESSEIIEKENGAIESKMTKPAIIFQTIIDFLCKGDTNIYYGLYLNLSGAVLKNLDLREAKLNGANLNKANLNGAHLEGVHLIEADLNGAYLFEAHLEGAYLEGVYLIRANLTRAHLNGAPLYGTNLEGAHLNEADLYGAYLFEAHLEGANLYGANLEGANLTRVHLNGTHLNGTHLEGVNFSGSEMKDIDLSDAIIDDKTNFRGTPLENYDADEITKPGRSLELTKEVEGVKP